MDDRRFDELTRRLASRSSRRQVLKTLGGGALGGLAGALRLGRAGAAGCNADAECARGATCDPATGRCIRRGGNGRPANQNQTQSQSVGIAADCTSDPSLCAPNETCVDGVCRPRGGPCTRGSACTTDATCCGGEICDTTAGMCIGAGGPCTNNTGVCFDSTDCCGNEGCVGGLCQRTAGGCAPGAVCAVDAECCGGQVCVNATCAQAARTAGCPEGQVRCSGTCVDIQNDEANCGACGVVCPAGQTCTGGTCLASGELCGRDGSVICGPCEFCTVGSRNPQCLPCNPCQQCVNGTCVGGCGGCSTCVEDPVTGDFGCGLDGCAPCGRCNTTDSTCEPVFQCGPCANCGTDANNNPICLTACSDCAPCNEETEQCDETLGLQCNVGEYCEPNTGTGGPAICKPICGNDPCRYYDPAVGCTPTISCPSCAHCETDPLTGDPYCQDSCARECEVCAETGQCLPTESC